jgi:hypothetical protein
MAQGAVGLTKLIQGSLFLLTVSTGVEFGGHHSGQDSALEDPWDPAYRAPWSPAVFLVHSDLDGGGVTETARNTGNRERVGTSGCS